MSFGVVYVRVALLLGLLLLAYAANRLASRVAVRLWRAGYDPTRRLAQGVSLFSLLSLGAVGALGLFWVAGPTLGELPWFTALALCGAGTIVALPLLQNLGAGVYLSSRRELREDDEVRLGELVGTVREMGLLRIRLQKPDGSNVLIPNRLALQAPLVVQRSSGKAHIVVDLELSSAEPDTLELLREAALLCPYRVAETPVHVRFRAGVVEVELETWRPGCQQEVSYYLQAAYWRGVR